MAKIKSIFALVLILNWSVANPLQKKVGFVDTPEFNRNSQRDSVRGHFERSLRELWGSQLVGVNLSVPFPTQNSLTWVSDLNNELEAALQSWEGRGQGESTKRSLRAKFEMLEPLGKFSPLVQKYFMVESYLQRSDREISEQMIDRALRLHPASLWPTVAVWDASFDSGDFWAWEQNERRRARHRREFCQVDLEKTSWGEVAVNGFKVDPGRYLKLPTGQDFYVQLGAGPLSKWVRCEKKGIYRFGSFRPASQTFGWQNRAELILKEQELEAIFIFDIENEQAKVWLFSSLGGFRAVPLEKVPSIRDWVNAPSRNRVNLNLSLSNELFTEAKLVEKELPFRTSPENNKSGAEGRWYNDWKFWLVIGGVAGVGTLSFLASQPTVPSFETRVQIK